MRGDQTINGKEARLYIDGELCAYAKNLEATIEKAKEDVPILGKRFTSKKVAGVSGSGTLTIYKVTSKFQESMLQYIRTGRDSYFTVQSVLDDPGSGRGVERATLYDVNIDSTKFAGFDVETASLEEEVPFTFEGADLPESLSSTIV